LKNLAWNETRALRAEPEVSKEKRMYRSHALEGKNNSKQSIIRRKKNGILKRERPVTKTEQPAKSGDSKEGGLSATVEMIGIEFEKLLTGGLRITPVKGVSTMEAQRYPWLKGRKF